MNQHLDSLDLSANVVDAPGVSALADMLRENTTLSRLCLTDNYLGVEGAKQLAAALEVNIGIRELQLAKGNDIEDEGALALCEALSKREAPLEVLDLGGNSLTERSAEALVPLIARGDITNLNLNGNDLGDSGILKLAEALKQAQGLTTLDLGGNSMGPKGIEGLAAALKGHPGLTYLELGCNALGEEGIKFLADAIKFDVPVQTLRLGWCHLGSTGSVQAIGELVSFCPSLVNLDLRGNGFGDSGAVTLSHALRQWDNDKLRELDLGYNEVGDDGACQIARAMKDNPFYVPRELKINNNRITTFGSTALKDAFDMVVENSKRYDIIMTI